MSEGGTADSSQDPAELICPACTYDLRHIESRICPECGTPFDPAKIVNTPVPWECRRDIGWIYAFFITSLLAMFRPRLLSRSLYRPVNPRAAKLFRWIITIPLVALVSWYVVGLTNLDTDTHEFLDRNTSLIERDFIHSDPSTLWAQSCLHKSIHISVVGLIAIMWTVAPCVLIRMTPRDARSLRARILANYLCVPLLVFPVTPIIFELQKPEVNVIAYPQGAISQSLYLLLWGWWQLPFYLSPIIAFALWEYSQFRLLTVLGQSVWLSLLQLAFALALLVSGTVALWIGIPMLVGLVQLMIQSYSL